MQLAHIAEDGRQQTVQEHLENTAELAEKFADAFDAGKTGYAAGLLHDIGKYSEEFQKRIRGSSMQVDHSTAGSQLAFSKNLLPAAFSIAGHHGGIPDGGSQNDSADNPTLLGRIKKQINPYDAWKQEIEIPEVHMPEWILKSRDYFEVSFFIRMIYSCLVDADFLDTEAFMDGKQPRGGYESLQQLLDKLRRKMEPWLCGKPANTLNEKRSDILRTCMNNGHIFQRGLYTLTVPTGGGKTTASLAFALEHGAAQGMERVIYVIPYTSIIDQTVDVFNNILGEENILAHHSEAGFLKKEKEDLTDLEYRSLLASENWDAPVVVTTAVQFFESLFSNKNSRCRKIHNIADSVIIFDEAQTLPVSYLKPCIAAIAQLVKYYKATVVLCTATQPSFDRLFRDYGLYAKEIYPDSSKIYSCLRRTKLKDAGVVSKGSLAELIRNERQVLCVVNRRKTAQDIFYELNEEGSYCLTTLLCAEDRKNKLDEIRQRLKQGLDCRVISTSLIEAGVDVDFPVAYREEAGLDSFIQTAGRCNREGKISDSEKCPVYLFAIEVDYSQ